MAPRHVSEKAVHSVTMSILKYFKRKNELTTSCRFKDLLDQHFYSTLLGRGEEVCKKSTLCTLVKIEKIMDGPLLNLISPIN